MRRSRTRDQSEDESRGVFNRIGGTAGKRPADESRSWVDRVRQKSTKPAMDESRGLFDRPRRKSAEQTDTASQGWFGRARAKYGLGALLAAIGLALVLFPEPATSAAGLVLIGVGALIWLVSWFR